MVIRLYSQSQRRWILYEYNSKPTEVNPRFVIIINSPSKRLLKEKDIGYELIIIMNQRNLTARKKNKIYKKIKIC